ncbi:hypothetical protein [Embleya sp. NBC_00896]|uniref:hypothetical protein n=1 Tax=Embleya sp. NBC_00896 TaxID=2975961 RepID=UPI0038650CCA|nr:hypothetical protein OG928_03580 [Embleya sp. NBC_00896]
MRIRTTLIAVAGAALFAFAGAGTAQAYEHSDFVLDHNTSAGAFLADGHGGKIAAWSATNTFIKFD